MEIKLVHDEVLKAHQRIKSHIHKTSLMPSKYLSKIAGAEVFLKCENEQYTGSFKARGSLNKLRSIGSIHNGETLVTASTGNHGLGFARALEITGMQGRVYVPSSASKAKIDALSQYDVELIKCPGDSLFTEVFAKNEASKSESIWVSPYNDLQVLAGQGTTGLEILEQEKQIDEVFVTVGGGGLMSGIGAYLKYKNPNIRMMGCQPQNSPEMTLSLSAGRIVAAPESLTTLSDGSAGGIEEGAITFELCQKVIDENVLISEEEIREAIRIIAKHHKKIIEGAAGVAVAACIKKKENIKGKRVVVVLCGSNIDLNTYIEIISS